MRRREFTSLGLAGAVGAAVEPPVVRAQTASDSTNELQVAKGIALEHCCGVVIDVQGGFYSLLDSSRRPKIRMNIKNFVRLLGYFRVPLVVTLESPVDQKGPFAPGDQRAPE